MDYHINAKDRRLGHIASEIAVILQGKNSPDYAPNKVGGSKVFLKNYLLVSFSPKKMIQKMYYRHTGYMGHLKELSLEQMWQKDPKRVIREAVRKMLPKNSLNPKRLKKLVFID